MEIIETVKEHCIHPDCAYRGVLTDNNTPFCAYILYERQSRKCPISQCTRYKAGKLKVGITGENIWVEN